MKNKLIVTFFLLILCAGSVTTALKSFDNVQNNIETAKKIQTARLEAAKVTPTPTPEPQAEPELSRHRHRNRWIRRFRYLL